MDVLALLVAEAMRSKGLVSAFLPVMQLFTLALLTIVVCIDVAVLGSQQEGNALKMFIASADPEGKVVKQWDGDDPCGNASAWLGVKCDTGNVVHLVLEKINLTGSIPEGTLSQLSKLKVLSLSGNGLTGRIPADLSMCARLSHLYMQDNALSGPIPSSLSVRVNRIDLSHNNLSSTIPSSLADVQGLLTLLLDSNMLQGRIPSFNQTSLTEFNVSNNNLSGVIPLAMSSRNMSANAFTGNALLCGPPLQECEALPSPPSNDVGPPPNDVGLSPKATQKDFTGGQTVAVIVASVAFVFIIFCFIFACLYKRSCLGRRLQNKGNVKVVPCERPELQSVSTNSAENEDKPRLVFFEEANTFQLENLLQASAELLGKGTLGCAYKALLEDGRAMCVKRLEKLHSIPRREFEKKMQLVGRLRHPNVVPLWAYYCAKEEMLLVYEYQANGNLLHLLSAGEQREAKGSQATMLKMLSWNARLKIAKGIANGLSFLHHEFESEDLPHGNIKASNILISEGYEAQIADFGLALLRTGLSSHGKLPGIQAPELNVSRQPKLTQKADVYSFGVLLLELLTGKVTQDNEDDYSFTGAEDHASKLPQWVASVVKEEWSAEVFDTTLTASPSSEESLIRLLQVAMACTCKSPDKRPHMTQVHRMIADICDEADTDLSSTILVDRASFEFMSNDDSTRRSL